MVKIYTPSEQYNPVQTRFTGETANISAEVQAMNIARGQGDRASQEANNTLGLLDREAQQLEESNRKAAGAIQDLARLRQARKQAELRNRAFQLKTRDVEETAQAGDIYSNAVLEYVKRTTDRKGQLVDEQGNPIFENLPKDLDTIGKEVLQDISSTVKNGRVKQKLQNEFADFLTRDIIQSYGTSRQQKEEYAKGTLFGTLDKMAEAALGQDNTMLAHTMGKVDETIQEALINGVDSTITLAAKENFRSKVSVGKMEQLIENDPRYAKQLLESSTSEDLFLNVKEHKALKEAVTKSLNQIQNQQAIELELDILKGKVPTTEEFNEKVSTLSNEKQISLRKQYAAAFAEQEKDKALNAAIDEGIKMGYSFSAMDGKIVDKAYKERTMGMGTLTQKATIAGSLKGVDVKPFKDELELVLRNSSNPGKIVDAIRALDNVKLLNAEAVDGLSQDTQRFAASVKRKIDLGISPEKAIEEARKNIFDPIEPEIKKARDAAFRKIERFDRNSDEFQEVIRDVTGGDRWFRSDAVINPDVLDDIHTELYENFRREGSEEGAIAVTKALVGKNIGVSNLNGTPVVMKLPPEKTMSSFIRGPEDIQASLDIYLGAFFEQVKPNLEDMGLAKGLTHKDVVLINNPYTVRYDNKNPDKKIYYYSIIYRDDNGVNRPLRTPEGQEIFLSSEFVKAQVAEFKSQALKTIREVRIHNQSGKTPVSNEAAEKIQALYKEAEEETIYDPQQAKLKDKIRAEKIQKIIDEDTK